VEIALVSKERKESAIKLIYRWLEVCDATVEGNMQLMETTSAGVKVYIAGTSTDAANFDAAKAKSDFDIDVDSLTISISDASPPLARAFA